MSDNTEIQLEDDGLRAIETLGGTFTGGIAMGGDFKRGPRIIVMPQVGGASKRIFELGNTVGIEAKFYDEDGDLFSPLNDTAQIRIINPRKTTVLDWTAMDPRGIGLFLYQHQLELTDLRGTYRIQVRAQLPTSEKYIMNGLNLIVEVVV